MIAISGANGLLGSFLLEELSKQGHSCTGLVRNATDSQYRKYDLDDITGLVDVLKGVDTVIHCAAKISFDPRYNDEMYHVNVHGTENLINASLEAGAKRFMFISSGAAIPGKPRSDRKNSFMTYYGFTKQQAELEVWRGAQEGLEVVILNPTVILSPFHGDRSSGRLISMARSNIIFHTKGDFNAVDIRDVSEIVTRLIQKGFDNQQYILSGFHISYRMFYEQLSQIALKSPLIIAIPDGVLRIVVPAEGIVKRLIKKERSIPRDIISIRKNFSPADNSKIVNKFRDFSFRQYPAIFAWIKKVWEDNKIA